MRKEERWPMYFAIQEQKRIGLRKSQVARNLNVSRNTVIKFWNMTVDEYKQFLDRLESRSKKLESFETEIVNWLRKYPDLSAAQVMDWLKERHESIAVAESTVRSYVRGLRMEYGIPKEKRMRQYEAVEELPMGRQMQVDFGETKLRHPEGHLVKLWFITFVLSHSRYKYALWQDKPFTTVDVVTAHELAFAFYGGIPEEIVYDQDHLLLTSENHGDLILTHEFAKYVEKRAFRIHMCRKGDPESKGKIENVVKFIKRNFARHRSFTNIDKLNEQCLAWLNRTGNANMHHTTKKIPAEVYALEKAHLRPVHEKIEKTSNSSITRTVRKDNTIWYESNRYSVPIGTYDGTDKEVAVRVTEDHRLIIYEKDTGQILAEHTLCLHSKGELIRNRHHGRDRTKGVPAYIKHVSSLFKDIHAAHSYLEEIYKLKPRYMRDQLQAIEKSVSEANESAVSQALAYCVKHRLHRAADFADAVSHYMEKEPEQPLTSVQSDLQMLVQVDDAKLKAKPQIREFQTYRRILGGG
ncbi:IS21 family transposase [Escherichia coli]|nr:IS21 family transposase [Escherichia coli]